MEKEPLLIEISEKGVATLSFNNPERKNAMSTECMVQLKEKLAALDTDSSVRVIVIRGVGHNFTTGGNLGGGGVPEDPIDFTRRCLTPALDAIRIIQQSAKPVIALVEGWCVGAGFSLALACDMIFASEDARFWHNFLSLGLSPEMGAMLTLPAAVGPQKAKQIWFTAKKISAAEGKEYGFVNEVYSAEEIDAQVYAIADTMASMAANPLAITKALVNSMHYGQMNMLLASEAQTQTYLMNSEASRKAMMANFMKK